MSLPAVVLLDVPGADLKVDCLSVVERLIVALHRGGCTSITVVGKGKLPAFRRVPNLGIEYKMSAEVPAIEGPTVLANANLLVLDEDVRRAVEQRGRLVRFRGEPLPLGVAGRYEGNLEKALEDAPAVVAEGAAMVVDSEEKRKAAGKQLWLHLISPADGIIDRFFNRPIGRRLSKVLIRTPVSPNQVTIFSMLLGLVAAWLLAFGTWPQILWGALIFQLATMIDCVDGDIARVLYKETRLGKWLDIGADQVVHVALYLGIAYGLWRVNSGQPVLVLGAVAALGVIFSAFVVIRSLRLPEEQRSGAGRKLIDAAATRDFSVVLIALAALDHLVFFLWLSAIGVHVFWLLALFVQLRNPTPPGGLTPPSEKHP